MAAADTRACPAVVISAPASGQGKTTVTAALARYHRRQGRRVRVFKVGPDFIDPMILTRASGQPVWQLDLWMGGDSHCQQLLYQAAGEAVFRARRLHASYMHLYFPSNPMATAALFAP